MTEATPRPWKLSQYGNLSGSEGETIYLSGGVRMPSRNHPKTPEAEANQRLIIKAVNTHDRLVAAATAFRAWCVSHDLCPVCEASQNEDCPADMPCGQAYEALEAAKQ